MPFTGAKDGRHYWLTPEDLLAEIQAEFEIKWGSSNYVNPPFGAIVYEDGKKKGATAWARKCITEFKKGKRVVMVYPIDKWILMLLEAGAKVRNLKDVKWLATEDRLPGNGTGRHIAMFILDPEENK